MSDPRVYQGPFPCPDHRTMAEVMRDERVAKAERLELIKREAVKRHLGGRWR